MGKYLTDLDTRDMPNGKHLLISDLYYKSSTVGRIIVPEGFITDFASIPRWPIIYWLFGGLGNKDATLHDWLYTAPHDTGTGLIVDRATADKVLRGARYSSDRIDMREYEMVNLGAVLNNWWAYTSAWWWWIGVRLDGWRHWG